MRSLLSVMLVAALAGCASAPPPAPRAGPAAPPAEGNPASAHVDAPKAHALVAQGAVLVDVRSPDEFATKHVEGATNVPIEGIATHDFGGKDRPLVLYCNHGNRSEQAAATLRSQGYTRVYVLGAMSSWGQ